MFEQEKNMISHQTLELARWFGNFVENLEKIIISQKQQIEALTAENKRLVEKYEPKEEKVSQQ